MSRFDYVQYDKEANEKQAKFKAMHQELGTCIENLKPGRSQAVALTKLEECYMWVGKALRDEQIARNGSTPLQEERKNG